MLHNGYIGSGTAPVIEPLVVTQNGTYNVPEGVDGYAPITVNVSEGGTQFILGVFNVIKGSQFLPLLVSCQSLPQSLSINRYYGNLIRFLPQPVSFREVP